MRETRVLSDKPPTMDMSQPRENSCSYGCTTRYSDMSSYPSLHFDYNISQSMRHSMFQTFSFQCSSPWSHVTMFEKPRKLIYIKERLYVSFWSREKFRIVIFDPRHYS